MYGRTAMSENQKHNNTIQHNIIPRLELKLLLNFFSILGKEYMGLMFRYLSRNNTVYKVMR